MRREFLFLFSWVFLGWACAPSNGQVGSGDDDGHDPDHEAIPDLRTSDDPDAQFVFSDAYLLDENDDGVWSPGESATVFAQMTNIWAEDHMWYPGALVSADEPSVVLATPEFWFFGMFGGQSQEVSSMVTAPAELAVGTAIIFTFEASSLSCQEQKPGVENCPLPNPLDFRVVLGEALPD